MSTGITATSIFPLDYPKSDPTIPAKGAKAVSVVLDWSKDAHYDVSLLQVQEQNFFGSLRCIWIDASAVNVPITVAVNGTEQIFVVPANTSNYYAVINLNVPVVTFTIGAETASIARLIFLNFVPSIAMQEQLAISGTVTVSGSVSVTNFPATQNVNLTGTTVTQPVSGSVSVSNFPAIQAVSQSGGWSVAQSGPWTVGINNFPATQPVSGTVNANQSGIWNVNATQAGSWSVGILSLPSIPAGTNAIGSVSVSNFPATQPVSGTVTVNQGTNPWTVGTHAVTQSGTWNVTVNTALPVGTNTIGNVNAIQSGTWTVQQGGSNWTQNVAQWGGSATSLGQKTSANSVPVVVASDNIIAVTGVATGVGTNIINSTTAQNITGGANAHLTNVTVTSIGAVLAAGSVTLSVTDGSGTLRVLLTLPTATTTATSPFLICEFNDVFISLTNNGSPATVKLSANLTSGSFVFGFGLF